MQINIFFKITFIRPDLQKRTSEERIAKGKKTREKTREKIILLIKEKPKITMKELAGEIGITEKGVEWQIKKLRDEKIIKRVGPAKGGHWEILQEG
jgi:ATP-dependent DNA helicase RecG